MDQYFVFIQHDWEESVRSVGGKAWISIKPKDMASIYGHIECSSFKLNGMPVLQGSNSFEVESVTALAIQVKHPSCGLVTLLSPYRVFNRIHKKSVTSLDVVNGQCVSASDSILKVWSSLDLEEKEIKMTGHYGDIYCCRWFPSVEVVLSCGADLRIKIWSAHTGECAMTLQGHTSTVTDLAIVERGRNIISVSKDGTAKLWHVASGKVLDNLIKLDTSINCCSLNKLKHRNLGERKIPTTETEVGTDDKVLFIGCENGILSMIGIYSREIIVSSKLDVAVNACLINDDSRLFAGCNDGRVLLLDDNLVTLYTVNDTTSPVKCMCIFKDRIVSGHADGSCVARSNSGKKTYFTGTNSDSIYDVNTDGRFLYTACRDGIIRKYLPELFT
ncbi:proteasomal ATPase-associated factor 1-like [Adelges cooleyi]|uniref:proteasomal ATPase-associated factor 1-like n=1 Tax=Adelges cooleyi TaxID=133065 RepID=UPI00217F43C7|nr:proteasomal ATPase-associated factor 1-like [Adelges cooleyi]XP_050435956.1 proteasomal ATPase-associated factor 1-like [Adelges cooleyi]XP_050435957.1 proteasomal ATPase-associated factor 1-like [Adelges cooleyi]XP_050435958.1 proteasomal ATPase-associated factor 1-like [Adelges cooleyi]